MVLLLLLALALPAAAREVSVPIRFPDEFVRQTLIAQVYTDPGETARVWDDGSGCNFLVLANPHVSTANGRLRIVSTGAARVGTAVGQHCLTVLDWKGTVEVFEEPWIEPGAAAVSFRVVESNVYGPNGNKQAMGVLWDWVKQYVHPRLAVLKIDLQGPLMDLRGVLPLFLSGGDADRARQMIDSISLAEARAADDAVTVTVRFVATARTATPLPAPEPTLSADELQRWEAAWQQWDAFLTFVVKHAADDASGTANLQRQLFDVLVDARYDLVEALAPSSPHDVDPVRQLFLTTWSRLAPVLRNLGSGLPAETALRYLSFVAAADALQALDQLGPDAGVEISADGLRRLARIVAPTAPEDPIAYDVGVDPTLRRVFGFGDPLPPPEENPDVDLSSWLLPRAWAAGEPDSAMVARLNSWVPSRDELQTYLPMVRDLLDWAARAGMERRNPGEPFRRLYRQLVLATAWQESCWRQFIKTGATMRPITSPVGAIGMMQVNEHVWRGFYDRQGLARDISYNARAGSEILGHYLVDYAIAKGEHKTGSAENLARATYAAYNGGPGALARYRKKGTRKSLQMIDSAFWVKFQAVKDGNEMGVAECFGLSD